MGLAVWVQIGGIKYEPEFAFEVPVYLGIENWDNDKFLNALAVIDKRDGVQDGKATLDA